MKFDLTNLVEESKSIEALLAEGPHDHRDGTPARAGAPSVHGVLRRALS